MPMKEFIPNFEDVQNAAETLQEQAYKTPLLRNPKLDALVAGKVFIKPENLQRTGSFKFRGAFYAISNISIAERKAGVVACSSGNHAQGVASAAQIFEIPATIVMPKDAPRIKIERTRSYGAEVVLYDRTNEDRDEIAKGICQQTGGVFIHPYDNGYVIAGQGTAGMEAARELREAGLVPDRALLCTGGGGLTAGCALSFSHYFPKMKIHSVEPLEFDDYRRSLLAGEILQNEKLSGSVCDAILSPSPGQKGFEINRKLLADGLTVTDKEALGAVKFAFEELKLVCEPGGAVALAALLKHALGWKGETIVVVVSGGNVDPEILEKALRT